MIDVSNLAMLIDHDALFHSKKYAVPDDGA